MAVSVDTHSTAWRTGTPTKLFDGPYYTGFGGGNASRQFDVSADGQRFLMIKEHGVGDQDVTSTRMIVVQHWTEELKRLVPAK